MPRAFGLLPELCLAAAGLTLFAAMLAGPRYRAIAHRVLIGFVVAALLACLATYSAADDFLFLAYRLDAYTQYAKAIVLATIVLALAVEPAAGAGPAGEPILRVCAALTLAGVVGATDLVFFWLLWEATAVALLMEAATRGTVRRAEVGRWIGSAVAAGLGIALLAGRAGTTRLADVADWAPELLTLPVAAGGALLVATAVLWRGGLAPVEAVLALYGSRPDRSVALWRQAQWTAGLAAVFKAVAVAFEPALGASGLVVLAAVLMVGLVAAAFVFAFRAAERNGRLRPQALVATLALAAVAVGLGVWARAAATALP